MVNHVVIDAQMLGRGGDYILDDEQRMYDFLILLVKTIGMKILRGPEIERGHIDLPGLTGNVLIETSHIHIHTFTRTGDIWFDICSCVPFQQDTVEVLFKKFYPCQIMDSQVIKRRPILTSDYQTKGRDNERVSAT